MVNRRSLFVIGAGGVVALAALALWRSGRPILPADADQLILYSIDGNRYESGKEPKTEEMFHNYPVLGKVEVTDPAAKKEIVNALETGLARGADLARCFWPRHGVRFIRNGETIDSVICFECLRHTIHRGDERIVKPTDESPQPILDRFLTAAGVPLAPRPE